MQPAVCVGNAGQLALDLLINTSGAACSARLQTSSLSPCIGCGAYDQQPSSSLATPLELYTPADGTVSYLQQRSPAALGQQQKFAEQLAQHLNQMNVEEVRLQIVMLFSWEGNSRRHQQNAHVLTLLIIGDHFGQS